MATNASSRRQFLVEVTGLTGKWAMRSGGAKESTTTKEFDGGALVPYVLTAIPVVEDVTVSRPFLPGRDDAMIANLLGQVGSFEASIVQTPTDPNYTTNGGVTTWRGVLNRVIPPDVDANSNDGAKVELHFTCSAVA